MTVDSQAALKLIASSVIVSDLERSALFYEALGFKRGVTGEQVGPAGSDLSKLAGIGEGPCRYRITMLSRPELNIALMQFLEPAVIGEYLRSPALRIGRGALMLFDCPNAEATAARLVELGGAIGYESKTTATFDGADRSTFLITDPDGFRIQLVTAPADLKALGVVVAGGVDAPQKNAPAAV
jgi:predicted enzyme related to lactoylglutathione lyase